MAISRGWVAGEVGTRLATQLADAGLLPTDTTGNLREPIDDALRMLGESEETITASYTVDPQEWVSAPASIEFLTLVEFTTLRRVLRAIGDRFDLSSGGDQFRLQQVVATVERMLTAVEGDVIRIFGAVPTGAGTSEVDPLVYMNLGQNTPRNYGVVSNDWPYTVVGVGDG